MTPQKGIVLVASVVASVGTTGGTRAADAGEGRRSAIVARIGEGPGAREITVGELEDRLAAMPPFQRAMLGATPDAVRRAFLADVLVRGALLDLAAAAENVAGNPAVEYALD